MNKTLSYIYFVIAGVWLADGFVNFFEEQDAYHIFLSYSTDNKYSFLAFKLVVGVLVILAGIRRLQMTKKS